MIKENNEYFMIKKTMFSLILGWSILAASVSLICNSIIGIKTYKKYGVFNGEFMKRMNSVEARINKIEKYLY